MNVLIIEDDPMVDFIHRNYLEKVNKFQIILSSDSISDALNKLDHYNIDLILLDIHIKEGNGIQFLENLRLKHHNCEVIIISAVNDGKIVKSGFHFGIVDYLIKPFTFERFESSITSFLDRKKQLNQHIINQNQIDKLKNGQNNKQKQDNIFLEKGLSESTYNLVLSTISTLNREFTIQELTDATNQSHVSVRKYVAFMEENEIIEAKQIYTKVGRPYKIYQRI
ncbi:response regulator [Streptococcus parauberis]|uniref:response regulator n=1 Tax=Streptococcus parauberis TaxID=1348 RepID=UPI00020CBDDF|nr:response regulator [Streptococcus parauberis]AEF25086.1 response regulator protein [Streptococcus parauberis KCTC 11537]UWM91644.1 response regulator [Streptococcus parauberis]WEM64134.1 response regulator [Streptococcus parauberis]GAJ60876.1 response regulator protein [Streptococcus parauberis]